MKKLLFFMLLSVLIPSSLLAINGYGTLARPYHGLISADTTWNSGSTKIYVDGDITITAHLTISSGLTVVFVSAGADLLVNGNGYLTASGGSGAAMIRFTADYNDNSNYGETGERWGHIVFNNPSGSNQSSLDFCIVEYGDVSSGSNTTSYGGGVYSNIYSNLNIANCIIRFNRATHGGAIMALSGASPTISNCFIFANTSTISGGGIYLHTNCTSAITNCIVDNNSTGSGGGGGLFLDLSGNIRVKNSTIVRNSSSSSARGQNIQYYNISNTINRPSFINCIAWGNTNSITHVNQPEQASDFVNCGIQDISTPASSYTNCIDLSGTNGDTAGPNFIAIDGSDWSIAFVSPCRDAGNTTIPPISQDYIGNPRVGPYDIGAFEVQYSRWTGTTSEDWSVNTNWADNTVPSGSSIVVIPLATNVAWITTDNVTVNNLLIESGGTLSVFNSRTLNASTVRNAGNFTINPATFITPAFVNEQNYFMEQGARATITSFTNNGTMNLTSIGGEPIPSLMFDSYSGSGTANIAMHLSGGGEPGQWAWHYVAIPSPVRIDKSVFTSIDPYNLMLYSDANIPDDLAATDNDGWIWHDGYGGTPDFSNLYPGMGYAFYHSTSSTVNFSNLTSLISNLGSLSVVYSGTDKLVPANYGFNLMGNSLTCGLNWNLITPSGDLNDVIYYTINYKIGSYVRGAPSGINGATQHIPPLQGFLVKANALGASLDFSSAREHTTQLRYKKGLDVTEIDSKNNDAVAPMIKLELNNSGNQDETLIWLNENATNTFDGNYDGLKLLSSGYDQIYTLAGTDKFGINGIPYPADGVEIPVAVKFRNAGSGYKIIASQLQGLENYNLTLTDKGNSNFIVDLKSTNTYTFSSEAGTFPDRFVLTIGTIATAISDVILPVKPFNVFTFNNTLNIDLLNEAWDGKVCTVNIYNLTGKPVLQNNKVELFRGDIKKIPLNLPQGIYIVEIKAENQKFVTKINIIK